MGSWLSFVLVWRSFRTRGESALSSGHTRYQGRKVPRSFDGWWYLLRDKVAYPSFARLREVKAALGENMYRLVNTQIFNNQKIYFMNILCGIRYILNEVRMLSHKSIFVALRRIFIGYSTLSEHDRNCIMHQKIKRCLRSCAKESWNPFKFIPSWKMIPRRE